jgi:hypothetical protein
MIDRIRYIWQLLVLASLLLLLGMLLIVRSNLGITPAVYLITLGTVVLVNLLTYLLMFAGIQKTNREGIVLLLAGIGLNFLLYLFFILLFWVATKNLSKAFIILFFALYLVFTFFTAGHLLKFLRNK